MILYITGRPDMQKQRVVSWLSQHNFPQGMIFFSDGLVHDPLRQKAIFLRNLMQEVSEGPAVGFQPHPRGRGLSGWPSLAGGGIRPRPPQLLPSSHNQVGSCFPVLHSAGTRGCALFQAHRWESLILLPDL